MDKRALIATGVILIIPLTILGIWGVQGQAMESRFADALQTGTVGSMHRDLQGKQWSSAELATIEVRKIPRSRGQARALARSVHSRGRIFLSSQAYAYQATIHDRSTDIVHVFGYCRSEPRRWQWQRIHPESMAEQMQRRMEQIGQVREPIPRQSLAQQR